MKELSVFVDESGDFGEYNHHSPYYIVTMVFHNQDINITNDVRLLENELSNIGWPNHCVHAGPVIRSEEEYKNCELKERQKILMKMMTFFRHLDITYGSVNLLFKDDVDDNIIRLENNNVASELLGISFCKESKNNEYKLPLE